MSDFNRGLEQGIALGELKERERIIKLLEEAPKANPKDYSDEDIWAFQKAIALIKDKVSA